MLKNIMKKRMLIMLLWGFPFCFCGGAEFPEFTVEDYGSVLVGSAERPVPSAPPEEPDEVDKPNGFLYILALFGNQDAINAINAYQEYLTELGIYNDDYSEWSASEAGEDWNRIHNDSDWISHVDIEYWEEFLNNYPEYYDEVYEYYQNNPTADNNPFYKPEPEDPSVPLSDDIGAIIGMILMGIAYGILAYRVRRQ